ncbi:MAG: N-acetyltransferase [Alphaproteobacteria bacterium]|nr:N-acetyltransferase [Alphaproteobacteria bacterium]
MDEKQNPVLVDLPMPIITPRLTLRPVMPGDGAVIAESVAETMTELLPWMPWARAGDAADPLEREIFARQMYADFILRKDMMMLGFERDSGRHVLCTGLHRLDWEKRHFMIGYWVCKSAQGRRYAAEGANALTRYAFTVLKARAVQILYAEGNDKSRRIIESLGFERMGTVPLDHEMPGGDWVAQYSYYRTSAEGLPPLDVSWGTG